MKFQCGQRGCTFEADELPEDCPVCNNPIVSATEVDDDEASWLDYTVDELREQLAAWEVEGVPSRATKAELIELCEAAEAERDDDDD